MRTHQLRIGSWNLTLVNVPESKAEYVKVDKDNNELEYVKGSLTKGYYVNPKTQETVSNVYDRINGKPAMKPKRTEATDKFKEVEIMETFDLKENGYYLVDNVPSDLLEKLKKGMAIKILYVPGSETNYGYVRINPYNKDIELVYGITLKSKANQEVKEVLSGRKKIREVTLQQDGVERVNTEDLLEL